MSEKNHLFFLFLLISLFVHLLFFYHYRTWSPAVQFAKLLATEKEPTPVQIIELPREVKKPQEKPVEPIKPRFLTERDRRAEQETRLEQQPPVAGPDRISRPAPKPAAKAAPPAPKTEVAKPQPKRTDPSPAKTEKEPQVVRKSPMGRAPIAAKPEEQKPVVEAPATPPANKLFPSYEELTQIAREAAEQQRAARLPKDIEAGQSIQLNTEQFKFHSYFIHLKRKIEGVWEYPYLARESGLQGRLLMRFVINRDGTLAETTILQSSGFPLLDHEAIRAVHDAAPFPPLPARMEVDRLSVTATFEYLLDYKVIR
ncbi:MAG: energy transducer TonB [Deltaproteobacteria bacterium]|nr:energy transducer TonB [Candidatus Anaeroferrophillus wilburensis]MBN2889649.1 energy transducer TonB [Deltaproteobacteria bacterium]